MSGLGERLADFGYATGWGLVKSLPEPMARGSFRLGADLAVRRDGPGVRQLRRNLQRVVPKAGPTELDELVRDGLRSYARYWMETFRLPSMDREDIYRRVDEVVVGSQLIDAALDRGKGVVIALPHTGNFDVSGIWLVGHAGGFTTVVERLRPESLYERFMAYRESLGFELIPASGGSVAPYRVLIERLRANGIVCLPADRDLSERGVPVTFFGAETRMPAGPARLAALTGAQLLIVRQLVHRRRLGAAPAHPDPGARPRRGGRGDPADGRLVRRRHRRQPGGLAHDAEAVARRPVRRAAGRPDRQAGGAGGPVRIGIVCPYSFEVPGGVQAHVLDLAKALRRRGHEVDVLAPADEDTPLPDFVQPAGRAVGIPYNGSVARLSFGPVSYRRVRRWIRDHDFDVLHLHEPTTPSLSLLALMIADGPIVATFHMSNPRSRTLSAFQPVLRPFLEKITARIAVSVLARRMQVEHLGGDAVEIPNGVDVEFFAGAEPLPGYPRDGGTVGFVGRFTEPRKGMPVLLDALKILAPELPALELLVVGGGDQDELRRQAGPTLRGPARAARSGRRRDQGAGTAQRRRLLRAQHRRRELRHDPHRGDVGRRRGRRQRPGRVPAGARRRSGRRAVPRG